MGKLLEPNDIQTNATGGKYRIYTSDGWIYGNHSFGLALAMTKTSFFPVLNALEIEGLIEKTPKYTIRLYDDGNFIREISGDKKRILAKEAQRVMTWLTQAQLMARMTANY